MDILLNPNVAYLFLVGGLFFAVIAVLTPGTGLIEIGAMFALALAGWGVYNLPINLWALIVLILGVFPFLIAVRKSRNVIYLVVSIAAFVIGSVFLFREATWWKPSVHPVLAVMASGLAAVFFWVIVTKTLDAEAVRPVHDLEKVIGVVGETKTVVHESGSVQVLGELWTARSARPIPEGVPIRVVGREGFVLEVEPQDED
ncbi:MAG: NfeD family protein [Chloroflexota bacterium]